MFKKQSYYDIRKLGLIFNRAKKKAKQIMIQSCQKRQNKYYCFDFFDVFITVYT